MCRYSAGSGPIHLRPKAAPSNPERPFSSANRVDILWTIAQTGTDKGAPEQIFSKNGLLEVSLLVDGQQVMLPYIDCGNATNLAMARIAGHGLCDTTYAISKHNIDGYGGYENNFVVSFELETLLNRSEILRTGLNLSSSISQLVFKWKDSGGATVAANGHIFVYHDALLSLDVSPQGTRNFSVSI